MELAKLADDEDSKAMMKAYKCAKCTTDNCNGATELRAGGVMTAILVSGVTHRADRPAQDSDEERGREEEGGTNRKAGR